MCHTDMHSKLLVFRALTDAIQTCIKEAHSACPDVLCVSNCETFYSKDLCAVHMSAMPFSLLRNVFLTSFWHVHTVVYFAVHNKSVKTIGCGTCVSTCETEESEVDAELQGGNCDGIDRSMAGNGKRNASGFLWPYFQHDALACTSVDQKKLSKKEYCT